MFKSAKTNAARTLNENLDKKICSQLCVAQKKWAINITRVTDSNHNLFTKIHEWAIDIDFSDWREKDDNELFVPMIAWLSVHQSTQAKNEIGVFAARNFKKGEVIGLFSGSIPTKKPSRFAITTKNHEHFDPLRGFADSGSITKNIIAMHHIIKVKETSLVNAKMHPMNLLVQATKDIAIGDEIFVKSDKNDKEQVKEDSKNTIYMKNRRELDEEKLINGFLTNDAMVNVY